MLAMLSEEPEKVPVIFFKELMLTISRGRPLDLKVSLRGNKALGLEAVLSMTPSVVSC